MDRLGDHLDGAADLDCADALEAGAAWIAGRELPCGRARWSAHLRACPECDAGLRAALELRARRGDLSSELDREPRPAAGRSASSRRRRGVVLFLLVGVLLLVAFHSLGRGAELVALHGSVRRLDSGGTLVDAAEGRLAPGTILVLADGAAAGFESRGLRCSVQGPARVRVAAAGIDLLAGRAELEGDGVLGTSRGLLQLDDAQLAAHESRNGLELACSRGAARLAGPEPATLAAGGRLELSGAAR